MSLDAIKQMAVQDIVATNAHLYLWVPNALLPDGLAVLDAWGFRYVSNIVWAKRRKDGGPDGRGVGFYFRNVTELILFGVRGSMRTLAPARSQVNMIETRKRDLISPIPQPAVSGYETPLRDDAPAEHAGGGTWASMSCSSNTGCR